jgi:nucleotide-binding universal stress UspA family protein
VYKNILIALDGSELAERVVPVAQSIAEKFGATVTLLRATTSLEEVIASTAAIEPGIATMPTDPMPIVEAERQESQTYLESIAQRLRARGLTVNCEVPEGNASSAILDAARRLGVDLIAMTTHGRTGLTRILFGSVAEAVLRHAPCPILLIRIHDES